jgi:hypothetical protein
MPNCLFPDLLSSCKGLFLQKLMVAHLVKKFPTCCNKKHFATLFTETHLNQVNTVRAVTFSVFPTLMLKSVSKRLYYGDNSL